MESSLRGVPLSATQMAPKVTPLTPGIRAPLTIDESDFEYSSKSRRNSIGSSYYSNSELESEGFVSGEEDEEILEEYGVYKPSVVKPNKEIVKEDNFSNEYGFSRPPVKNPDEKFAQESGDVIGSAVLRPSVGNPDEKISKAISDVADSDDSRSLLSESGDELVENENYGFDNVGSRPIKGVMDKENFENGPTPNLEIEVPSVQTLRIPIAKISRDSESDDDDSEGSDVLEDEGFLGIARVPSDEVLSRVDSAPKVGLLDDNESRAENMVEMEFVEDLIKSGILGPKDEKEHTVIEDEINGVIFSDAVQDGGSDSNEEDNANSLVVDEKSNSLSESGQNGDFMHSDKEIEAIVVTDDLNKFVDLVDEDTKSINTVLEDNLVFDQYVESEKLETESAQEIEQPTVESSSFIGAHKISSLSQCVDFKDMSDSHLEDASLTGGGPYEFVFGDSRLDEEIIKEAENSEKLHSEMGRDSITVSDEGILLNHSQHDSAVKPESVNGMQDFSPSEGLSGRERKKLEKIQKLQVKYLRLVHRLGLFPEDSVASNVLYQLTMAEARSSSQTCDIDLAKNAAMELETQTKDDLDFSLCILVIGKTGVGKSSTINSIFGESKTTVNGFEPSTARVREIVCKIDGVKVKVFDTPGLRTSSINQPFNLKILSSIKKLMQKSPPNVILYVDRLDAQFSNLNDLPLLKLVTSCLGSSIWQKSIIAFTHANSIPPDGPNGYPLSYEEFIAQQSRAAQQLISQSAGMNDDSMTPVSLVENHSLAKKNENGETLLHNGKRWRSRLLLLCYSMKILSELSSLVEIRNPMDHLKLFIRHRFLEPSSQILTRTVCDSYRDSVVTEDNLDILPAVISIRLTQDEKEFDFQLHSSVGNYQTFGMNKKLPYILKGDLNVNVSVGFNKKLRGKVSVNTRCSDQLQIAAMALLPIAKAVFDNFFGKST